MDNINELINKIEAIRKLTKELQEYSDQYYLYDNSKITDKQYDEMCEYLKRLEDETGFHLSNSPNFKVQGKVLDGFVKVKHSKPMLSADKTKDVDVIKKWLNGRKYYCSAKLDGLTVVLRYSHGQFVKAITRGDGYEGEDVTEQVRMISNVPMSIPHDEDLEVRGECMITWEQFKNINEALEADGKPTYSHVRNLASGTLRSLDTSVVKARQPFIAIFECVTDIGIDNKIDVLLLLNKLGFDVVPFVQNENDPENLQSCIDLLSPENCPFPMDGVIFELMSRSESEAVASTQHHEGCRMAFKWPDTLHDTTLRGIEWNTSRNGVVAPVAIFDCIDLDGAMTSRATLHNVSIIESLQLGIGDKIQVYRANMVIPAIYKNLTCSNNYVLPDKCPACGGKLILKESVSGTKTLHCTNQYCSAQQLYRIVHYCSKHAMNIENVSEATIETLIERGFIKSIVDLYKLEQHPEIANLNGFGVKSYQKMIESINKSKTVSLDRFIYALGINNIGRNAAKILNQHFDNIDDFVNAIENKYDFSALPDFGAIANESIQKWYLNYGKTLIGELAQYVIIDSVKQDKALSNCLAGLNIAVTGKLINFTRDSINELIEKMGGKSVSSVNAKTNYLINNDNESASSKNVKAKSLNIPIITEEEFLNLINSKKIENPLDK